MGALPQGFTLDKPQGAATLPPGFTVDTAQPTGLSAHEPTFSERNPRIMGGITKHSPKLAGDIDEVEGMLEHGVKNLYQISSPSIAASYLKEKFPSVANYLPDAMTRDAAPLNKLPSQIATTALPAMLGDEVPPEAGKARIPPPVVETPSSTMGSRALEVGKRYLSDNKLVRGAKDINYIARGEAETPAIAKAAKPAQIPETDGVRWGTTSGGPVSERGKFLPKEDPAVSSPSRTLPGMHSPERVSQIGKPSAKPIPQRSGLMLPEGDALAPFRNVEPPPRGTLPESPGRAEILKERVNPPQKPQISKPKVADEPPNKLGSLLNDSLGGEPLKPNIPLRLQRGGSSLPQDFTPADSSAVRGYKYDPQAKEMSVISKDGSHHIYGDVSPEQAQSFAKNPSTGAAWKELRDSSSAKVAKVVEGKRVSVRPPRSLGSASPDDLTPILEESLRRANK